VKAAESAGFDSAWVSEHHGSADGYLPSLLPALAAFAAVTERMKLGTGVLLAPFHHPLRLAEDAAVVDQLSGGRLLLGLGLGWRAEELRMFKVARKERAARLEEIVAVLRAAWSGERFTHHGPFHSFDSVAVTPAPARPGGPPLLIGGLSEIACRRSGRLGDGYTRSLVGVGIETGLAAGIQACRWADAGAAEAGRPSPVGFVTFQNAFVQEDGDAWATVRSGVSHQLGVYRGWQSGSDVPGRALEVDAPPDAEARALTVVGGPDEVAASLAHLVRGFADRDLHLVVRLHYPGMSMETAARAIVLFGSEVIPTLRTVAAESWPQ
jgi:probable F420-dependent oxidoreductase